MSRFFSRLLSDPHFGSFNEETQRLFAYHQATKHTYHSVRSGGHSLDWRNQPNPFRTYEGAPEFALTPNPDFPSTGAFAAMGSLTEEFVTAVGGQIVLDELWLSRLLWHSMAISAWKKAPGGGGRYSLRVNPSSGNLHPTETYLALRGIAGIDDGIYHYRADHHALELRNSGAWVEKLSHELKLPWAANSSLTVGLTSIFWREAWKYRDRAYRYCCHDLGHATMSLLLAARALGLPGGVVANFGDRAMTRALGLDGSDEAPMAFLVFPRESTVHSSVRPAETFFGTPNELSSDEVSYDLLLDMHRATILPDATESPNVNVLLAGEGQAPPEMLSAPHRDAPLGEVVRRRRSALDFDPRTEPMERCELEQLLDFATRDWRADWRGNFQDSATATVQGVDFVSLYLYVHRVASCLPGVYRWSTDNRTLELLHSGNVERVAAFLSLEQTLAGNSCFTISMIADLARAAHLYGNRAYRYVYFEAGAIGQRLYVGATALRWNATGIGAFYDDDVHRYLGFLEEGDTPVDSSLRAAEQATLVMLDSAASRHVAAQTQNSSEPISQVHANEIETQPRKDPTTLPQQVIYHFAVGRAIPDPRIED